MKKIILPLIILSIAGFANAYTFQRDLKVGSTGEDVKQLQIYLNNYSPQTQVSYSGSGSKGNETNYFGTLTQQALSRFQNLSNINPAVGYFGPVTRDFINKNQNSENTQKTTIKNENYEDLGFFVSKKTIQPKEILYVGSQTDLTNIDFYIDSYKMDKSCKHSIYTCAFRVNLDPGEYTLKTSDSSLGSYQIKIISGSEKAPEFSISTIYLNRDNLIKGDNFSEKVKIYTMYGVFESETKNDSFILRFPEEYVENATLTEGLFYIENENGLTSKVKNVKYEK